MIHIVTANETVDSIAALYGISPYDLAFDNQITPPYPLVPGQALWIQVNDEEGLSNRVEKSFFGYAYPFTTEEALNGSLPYLAELYHFSYGYSEEGELAPLNDEFLFEAASRYGVPSILVLTPLTPGGVFSNQLVNALVENPSVQQRLIDDLLRVMEEKGFSGVDVDFEYILPEDVENYVAFVRNLRGQLAPYGYQVTVALPPKTSDDQPGLLYEGIDYAGIGEAADAVFLMTYEWGYTYHHRRYRSKKNPYFIRVLLHLEEQDECPNQS